MKDPAALLYLDKWYLATSEMSSIARAYYMDLIISQYDKGDLPNDIEELASICRVRYSEFKMFEQVFEQVLKRKFEENENGRLENKFASEIIQKRKSFVEKKSKAGKMSYVLKYFKSKHKINKSFENFIKETIDLDFDLKNEQMLEQVFKQISELYINVNINEDINIDKKENNIIYPFNTEKFISYWKIWKEYKKKEHNFSFKSEISEQAQLKKLSELSNNNETEAIRIIDHSLSNGYKGLFQIKANKSQSQSISTDYKQQIIKDALG